MFGMRHKSIQLNEHKSTWLNTQGVRLWSTPQLKSLQRSCAANPASSYWLENETPPKTKQAVGHPKAVSHIHWIMFCLWTWVSMLYWFLLRFTILVCCLPDPTGPTDDVSGVRMWLLLLSFSIQTNRRLCFFGSRFRGDTRYCGQVFRRGYLIVMRTVAGSGWCAFGSRMPRSFVWCFIWCWILCALIHLNCQ